MNSCFMSVSQCLRSSSLASCWIQCSTAVMHSIGQKVTDVASTTSHYFGSVALSSFCNPFLRSWCSPCDKGFDRTWLMTVGPWRRLYIKPLAIQEQQLWSITILLCWRNSSSRRRGVQRPGKIKVQTVQAWKTLSKEETQRFTNWERENCCFCLLDNATETDTRAHKVHFLRPSWFASSWLIRTKDDPLSISPSIMSSSSMLGPSRRHFQCKWGIETGDTHYLSDSESIGKTAAGITTTIFSSLTTAAATVLFTDFLPLFLTLSAVNVL